MDDKPEVIRHRIDETRSALTEKLETLEREVRGTVCEARDAVTCTVETVRETVNSTLGGVRETVSSTVEAVRDQVQDTMCSVREALNVQHQVQAHPWVMLGGSVAAGYLLGSLLPQRGPKQTGQERPSSPSPMYGARQYEPERAASWSEPAQPTSRAPGFLTGIADQFAPEIQKVKGMAIGAAIGLVRDLLKQQIPEQLAGNVDEVLDSMTTKLGGEPMRGSVLEAFTAPRSEPRRSSFEEQSFARTGAYREDPGERRFDM